ncbi:MAG: YlxR family protein [Lachnospiraceae bacterium]|nr:YlxR family protein [Lachnospiraceae bacterium]
MAKKIPQRSCAGCGAVKDKTELMRVIRTPEGQITLDRTGRAAGRGAYVCRDLACLTKLRKKNGLARSFGMPVPEEIYDALEKEFEVDAR